VFITRLLSLVELLLEDSDWEAKSEVSLMEELSKEEKFPEET